jgi:hypothetical protein
MINLLMYILCCYGLAATIAISKIFEPARSWMRKTSSWGYKLIKCPMCLSFWIGLLATFAAYPTPTNYYMYNAFIAVGSTYLLHAIIWKLALKDKDF